MGSFFGRNQGPAEDAERLRYQLSGETLTVVSDGKTSTWRRVGGAAKKPESSVDKKKTPDDSSGTEDAKKQTEKRKSSTGATIFKEHKLTDPGMNNIVASTFLVPEGWTAEGEMKRMPPSVYSIPVVADLKFTAPDGRQVHFSPSLTFDFDNAQPGQILQPTMKGNLYMPVPQSPGSWLMEMAQIRPDPEITNLKLVSEEEVPEVTQLLRQQNQQLFQMIADNNRMGAQTGLMSSYDTQGTKVLLTYESGWSLVRRARVDHVELPGVGLAGTGHFGNLGDSCDVFPTRSGGHRPSQRSGDDRDPGVG